MLLEHDSVYLIPEAPLPGQTRVWKSILIDKTRIQSELEIGITPPGNRRLMRKSTVFSLLAESSTNSG